MFKHDWSGIPDKPPRCKSCAGLGHFAQDCPNSKGDNPKGKGKSKGKGDGKGKDNSAGANPQGGHSVTNKAIVIEEVPQSQSASSSSGTPQPTIVVQTTTPPTTTPDLKTLIADLSSALKSEAKIHMKALEVEDPENATDVILTDSHFGPQNPDLSTTPKKAENVGNPNPSFRAENGGLGRPNGEDHTVLVLGPPKEEPILLKAPVNGGQEGHNRAPKGASGQVQEPAAERLSQLVAAMIQLRVKRVWLIVGLLMHLGKGLRRRCVQQSMFQSRWPVMRSPHFASHSWAPFSCLIPHNPLCQWVL